MWAYIFDDFPALGGNFIEENIRHMPHSRQEKCARYRHDSDKEACIVTYLLLLKGLWEHYGVESAGEFYYSRHGKPYLRDHPHIFFSLSHCKHGAACALADVEIGVDIQDVRPFDIRLARRVCSEGEMRKLSASKDPAKLFCRLWAEKESYAKAEGASVVPFFRKDLPKNLAAYHETENYFMALRTKGAGYEAAQIIILKNIQGCPL